MPDAALGPATRLQRLEGRVVLGVKADADGITRLDRLYQSGSARLRLPKGPGVEGVLINTGGGLTGGDVLETEVIVAAGARATVTTQAAEKVYRASAGEARVLNRLVVAGRLDWLPQETILFDGARLCRRLEVEMAPDATLLAAEATVFGRTARGERVTHGLFRDDWRIRRAGRLAYADAVRLEGDIDAQLARAAVAGGGRAVASCLYVAGDTEARVDAVREVLRIDGVKAGASAWNGLLALRLVAPDGQTLLRALTPLIEFLRGAPVPRVWRC
ncbi:urease accessory protein UreD [Nitrospirillum amazonense]|uniref:urease accessory protein UreD n=1 Tax=Nitrospirillum amazonense TaxID=28077 RepID=UPI002DD42D76|nr:urease accessory protein UreD [Nitrospirillum amazonense]MEC4593916.1 urease accessory protein UreD [Nitrospirillum amazonense]